MNENQLNRQFEEILATLFKVIGNFLKGAFFGIRKLKELPFFIGFLVSIVITILTVCFRVKIKSILQAHSIVLFYTAYYVLLIMPVIYLNLINKMGGNSNIEESFKKVNFMNKDGTFPYLINKKNIKTEDGKLINYLFSSSLNLDIWKGRRADIETALNCTIIRIEQGRKKTLVNIRAIPGSVRIDDFIPWYDEFIPKGDGVVAVGRSQLGTIKIDLNKTPHVLSAGETGSGKSVILRSILWQLITKNCRVYMIDFKGGVEFGLDYEKYGEVITEKERALEVLEMLTEENEKRLKLFRSSRVKNLYEYNSKYNTNLCRIGVVVDELAELMDKTGASKEDKELLEQIEKELSTLARLSRATGINLFFGVQRPDAKVITGQIKNNVPIRICGRFADAAASEIVLNNRMATNLPETKGRFLYKAGAETIEFQSFYFDDAKNLKNIDVNPGDMLIDGIPESEEMEELGEDGSIKDQVVMDEPVKVDDINLKSPNLDKEANKKKDNKDKFDFNY